MASSLGFYTVLVSILLSWIYTSYAEIHQYDNTRFTSNSNSLYVHGGIEALYASKPQSVSPAATISSITQSKGQSVIRFDDITFVRTKEAGNKHKSKLLNPGLVETIVFESKDMNKIGRNGTLCCTPELAIDGSCNIGEVIIRRDASEIIRIPTYFDENKEEVIMSQEAFVINKKGVYTVYFVACDSDLVGTVVRGRSVWKNQGGYFAGEKAPLLKFYALMFSAYMVLGLVWFPLVVWYWKDGIQLHINIALLIAFAIAESVFLWCDLSYRNSTGSKSPMVVTVLAVTLSSLRKVLSRLLVLSISSGYWIVKPNFSNQTLRMLLVGVLCFVLNQALGLANVSKDVMTCIRMVWAVLEVLFIHWIFRSLWRTLKKLKLNKTNIGKLQLYKKFATVLVIMTVLNIAWINVEMYIYDHHWKWNDLWEMKWMISAWWYVLAYVLLVLICFFWPPSQKPTRNLYIVEMEEEEGGEDLLLAEAGMNTKDGMDTNVVGDGRKTLLEAFILLFANFVIKAH